MATANGSFQPWIRKQSEVLNRTFSKAWTKFAQLNSQSARRSVQTLGRVSRFFLASWNGKYLPASSVPEPPQLNAAPETHPLPRAEVKYMPSADAPRPYAFVPPPAHLSLVPPFAENASKFTLAPSEPAEPHHFSANSSEASSSSAAVEHARLITEARQTLARQEAEFAKRLAQQLDSFNRQIASRLETLSGQVTQRFSEELKVHAGQALHALMSDWAEQNRVLVDAECTRHLDQFSTRLQSLSNAHLETYRQEMQSLSSNLKSRLRSVAHALQDVGPASHRS